MKLDWKNTFDRVSVDVKVLRVGEPVMVSGGIKKQDVTIADSTSPAKVSLWQNDIDCMVEGKSYIACPMWSYVATKVRSTCQCRKKVPESSSVLTYTCR